MASTTVPELERKCVEVRKSILTMLNAAGSGHAGGALGIVEVLVSLYFSELNISPETCKDPSRDRFVLSAAHMVPALYAVLAERGYIAKKELSTLREIGSKLAGHTQMDNDIGIETTGGSLGQGISIAVGMALAETISDESYRTYCVIGDGESNEGQVWEAAMLANKYSLDNLCVILDRNHIQLSESTEVVMPMEPVADKWRSFGWQIVEIDGNDISQVLFAFNKAKIIKGVPTLVLANTIPGKGVSFMEGKWEWHGKVPDDEELKLALKEIDEQ